MMLLQLGAEVPLGTGSSGEGIKTKANAMTGVPLGTSQCILTNGEQCQRQTFYRQWTVPEVNMARAEQRYGALVQTEVVQSRVVIWCSNDLLKSRIGQKAGDGLVMRSFGVEQSKMVQSSAEW